jgi:hypothetical protein
MSLKVKVIIGLVSFFVFLGVSAMVYNWYSVRFKPIVSQIDYITTPEIKKATKIAHKKIQVNVPLDTIDKDEAVKKLGIGEPVKSDKDKQIVATAEIQPYEGKTNVISVLSTKDGTSEIIAKQVPLSLLAFENKKRIGIRAGYSSYSAEITGEGYASWTFARIGKFHTALYGEVGHDSKAMLDIYYEF